MPRGLLENVRIIDLTRFIAGPTASKTLADMGAEVIKVESIQRMDLPSRRNSYAENEMAKEPWNRSGGFHSLHNSKKGITLYLDNEDGIDIFKQLVAVSDVVMENHSPRVLKNWGVDYPVLRSINPSIVLVSMSGFGQTGPKSNYVAFGPTMEAAAGFSTVGGSPGSPPGQSSRAYADWVTGMHGAAATLTALYQRFKIGKGGHIEVSGHEGVISHMGEMFLDYAMNKRAARPRGNRHRWIAPHGHYPCKNEDQWVTIAVTDDAMWGRFCQAAGHPEWATDSRFSSVLGRLEHQDDLDKRVEEWTKTHSSREVMEMLQTVGVASGAALRTQDQLYDPQLIQRGFFVPVEHPSTGKRPHYRMMPVKSSVGAIPPIRHAPLLGEHNREVLGGLLGLTDAKLARLEEDRVIGDKPMRLPSANAEERTLNIKFLSESGQIGHDPDYLEKLSKAYGTPIGPKRK